MRETAFDKRSLGNEAGKLLEALLKHADGQDEVQMSTSALTEASGLTQGGLTRGRTELTEHLLLRVSKGYSENGLRGANLYTLNLPALGTRSEPDSPGEPGQTWTDGDGGDPTLNITSGEGGSVAQNPGKRGFWWRLLRRS